LPTVLLANTVLDVIIIVSAVTATTLSSHLNKLQFFCVVDFIFSGVRYNTTYSGLRLNEDKFIRINGLNVFK